MNHHASSFFSSSASSSAGSVTARAAAARPPLVARAQPPTFVRLRETPRTQGLLTIDVVACGRRVVVRMRGEQDLSNRELMDRAIETVVAGMHPEVVFDVSELDFVDAHGLGSWRTAAGALHADGRELIVLSPAPLIARLLTVTGIDRVVRVERPDR